MKMDELVWPPDNSTGVLDAGTFNSTVALVTISKSRTKRSLSLDMIASVGLVIASIGSCANAVVIAVLIRARQQFGNSTHTLITNQSAMDLCATTSAVITSIVMYAHGYRYSGADRVLDGAICMFFEKHSIPRHSECRKR